MVIACVMRANPSHLVYTPERSLPSHAKNNSSSSSPDGEGLHPLHSPSEGWNLLHIPLSGGLHPLHSLPLSRKAQLLALSSTV